MAWIFSSFKRSAEQLRQVRTLALTGLLIALTILLSMYTLRLTPTLKLGFSFLGKASIGMFCGPLIGLLAGCVTDIVGFLLAGGGVYYPIFTLIEAFAGMLYGLFLYNLQVPVLPDKSIDELKLRFLPRMRQFFFTKVNAVFFFRALGARLAITVLCNLVMNTAALYVLYDVGAFTPWFMPRLIKNVVMFPIELIVMLLALPILKRLHDRLFHA